MTLARIVTAIRFYFSTDLPYCHADASAGVRGFVVRVSRLAVYQLRSAVPARDHARARVREPEHVAVLAGLRVLLGNGTENLPRGYRRPVDVLLLRVGELRAYRFLPIRFKIFNSIGGPRYVYVRETKNLEGNGYSVHIWPRKEREYYCTRTSRVVS